MKYLEIIVLFIAKTGGMGRLIKKSIMRAFTPLIALAVRADAFASSI